MDRVKNYFVPPSRPKVRYFVALINFIRFKNLTV